MALTLYLFSISLGLFICTLYFFYKKKKPEYKSTHLLIIYVLVTALLVESIGDYTTENTINNSLYYNILFVYLETVLFLCFFYLISISAKIKCWIKVSGSVFLLFGLFNTAFIQPIHTEFHNYSFVLGSLIIILLAINFFMEVLNLKRYKDDNLLSIPYFWIVTTVLFFYSASFIYLSSIRILYTFNLDFFHPLYISIQVLAGLMYIVFGLAFFAPVVFKSDFPENKPNN